jgi:hypothetical protein
MERVMEIELLDCRYITRKNPDRHTYSPHGGENVDPEAGIASGNSKVNGFFLPQFFQLSGCQEFSGQIIDFLMSPLQGRVKLNISTLSGDQGMFAGDMDIRH